jgi:hypothetical protein
MQFEKPVACSNTTSLPEVGGDAVVYFDPRRPDDIARAIADVLTSPVKAAELITRGSQRVRAFSGRDMTLEYLAIFEQVLNQDPTIIDSVSGVFTDGWTGHRLQIGHATGGGRWAELELEVPYFHPYPAVDVQMHNRSSRNVVERWRIRRGRRQTLRVDLPAQAGCLSFQLVPEFRPSRHGLGDDARDLCCLCHSIRISDDSSQGPNLLAKVRGLQ